MNSIFRFYTFSDKLSYKIRFALSYSLKDMVLARFDKLQEFSENSKLETETGPDLNPRAPDRSHRAAATDRGVSDGKCRLT
jgi:hypothetical protein